MRRSKAMEKFRAHAIPTCEWLETGYGVRLSTPFLNELYI